MKFDFATIDVNKGNAVLKEAAFSVDVEDFPLLLEFIRKHIYKNPIRTIVQEIIANANDAMREVGKAHNPIEIQLPTKLDPTCYIKDFGPSITPERMHSVYIKYCKSTKRGTNDFNGGFGIGAKTPWAYRDSFGIMTVTEQAHFEDRENCHVLRSYVAYIDESRCGRLAMVEEKVTDEPQGTTIAIPCNKGDESQFEQWLVHLTRFWEILGRPRPTVHGDRSFSWPEIDVKWQGENWFVTKKIDSYSRSEENQPLILLDGVPYPLSISDIDFNRFPLPQKYQDILSHPIRLVFETGELMPALNRENIDYSESAQKVIVERLIEAATKIEEMISQQVADAPNLWEAKILVNEICSDFMFRYAIWKEIEVNADALNLMGYNIGQYTYGRPRFSGRLSTSKPRSITCSNKTMLILDDNPDITVRPSRTRIHTIFNENPKIQTVVVFRVPGLAPDVSDEAKKRRVLLEEKEHFSMLGMRKISEFAKYKIHREKSQIVRVYKYSPYGKYPWQGFDNFDPYKNDGYWVVLNNRKPVVEDLGTLNDDLFSDLLQGLGITGTIWGVPQRFANALKKSGLVSIDELRKQEIDKLKNDLDLRFCGESGFANLMSRRWSAIDQYIRQGKIESLISSDSTLLKYFKFSQELEPKSARSHQLAVKVNELCMQVSEIGKNTEIVTLERLSNEFVQQYPLFKAMDRLSTVSPEHLAAYINMCDSGNQQKKG